MSWNVTRRTTLTFLGAGLCSFALAMWLTLSAMFEWREAIVYDRIQLVLPLWIMGVIGFLVFRQSMWFEKKHKVFAMRFLWAVMLLVTMWWVFVRFRVFFVF